MKAKLKGICDLIGPGAATAEYIERLRENLASLPDFPVTSLGPSKPDDDPSGPTTVVMTGARLKRASTNARQGKYLTSLVAHVATATSGPINVLELGSAVGISAMYLLAGIPPGSACHLYCFEGAPELARMTERHLSEFFSRQSLEGSEFSVTAGDFDETLAPFLTSMKEPVHLVFIDGNHREEATLRYHGLLRPHMHPRGVMIHDDIGWGEGMARAWSEIQRREGPGRTTELWQGNRPSRGVIFLGVDDTGRPEIRHIDRLSQRIVRKLKGWQRK